MPDVNSPHSQSKGRAAVWDALAGRAYSLLASNNCTAATPSVRAVRALHSQPPNFPATIGTHRSETSAVLPVLARYAQAGDPHALLMAAVLVRDQLRAIATHLGGGDDATSDTLAAFFTLLRTAAEPHTLTERSVAAQVLRCLYTAASGPESAVPLEPHAPAFDRPQPSAPDQRARAARLLEHARDQGVITALEHHTLAALYLAGTGRPAAAAPTLHASASTVERRAQRAIHKLALAYRHHRRALVGAA